MLETLKILGEVILTIIGMFLLLMVPITAWIWCITKIKNYFLLGIILLIIAYIISLFFIKYDILVVVYFVFVCLATLSFGLSLYNSLEKKDNILYYSLFCLVFFGSIFCFWFFVIQNNTLDTITDNLPKGYEIFGITFVVMCAIFIRSFIHTSFEYIEKVFDSVWKKVRKK